MIVLLTDFGRDSPYVGQMIAVLRRAAPEVAVVDLLADAPPHDPQLSASFHGRDLCAPVAARLARGMPVDTQIRNREPAAWNDWPDDLMAIVYIDAFGNAMTGQRATRLPRDAEVRVRDRIIPAAHTFSDVSPGEPFWYTNANGLVEIAVNQGRADRVLGLAVGMDLALGPIASRLEV